MRTVTIVSTLLLVGALAAATAAGGGTPRSPQTPEPLKVGERAPDFEIPATLPVPAEGSTISVGALTRQGNAVVLAFFPRAFTGG